MCLLLSRAVMAGRVRQASAWPASFVAGIPTLARSATHTRRKVGWRLLKLTKEHKDYAFPPFYPRAPPWAASRLVRFHSGGAA
ncbi:ash family protein [Pseudomonas sp. D2-3]